jgi:hypothetical protein
LVQWYTGKFSNLLRGSDAGFDQSKAKFLTQFEDHVKASVATMYTPQQMARRAKEIDDQVRKSTSDPEKIVELQDYLSDLRAATEDEEAGYGPDWAENVTRIDDVEGSLMQAWEGVRCIICLLLESDTEPFLPEVLEPGALTALQKRSTIPEWDARFSVDFREG